MVGGALGGCSKVPEKLTAEMVQDKDLQAAFCAEGGKAFVMIEENATGNILNSWECNSNPKVEIEPSDMPLLDYSKHWGENAYNVSERDVARSYHCRGLLTPFKPGC